MVSDWRKLWAAFVVVGWVLVVVPVAGAGIGDASVVGSVTDVASGAADGSLVEGAAPAPVVEEAATTVQPVVEVVEPLVEAVQPVLDAVQPVVDVAAPIVDAVKPAPVTADHVVGGVTSGAASGPAASSGGAGTPQPVAATPPLISVHPAGGSQIPFVRIRGLAANRLSSQAVAALVAVDDTAVTPASLVGAPMVVTGESDVSAPTRLPAELPAVPVALSPAGMAPGGFGFVLVGLALVGFLLAVAPPLLRRIATRLGAPVRPEFIALLERPG